MVQWQPTSTWDLPEAQCGRFVKKLDLASLWMLKFLGKDFLVNCCSVVHCKEKMSEKDFSEAKYEICLQQVGFHSTYRKGEARDGVGRVLRQTGNHLGSLRPKGSRTLTRENHELPGVLQDFLCLCSPLLTELTQELHYFKVFMVKTMIYMLHFRSLFIRLMGSYV